MSSARQSFAVYVCTFATFLVNVDNTAYQVALPTIREDLPASFVQGQWILNAYVLILAALELVTGALGDRFDKRRFLIAGLTVYVFGTVATVSAPNAVLLIGARVIAGAGAAVLVPMGLAMMRVLAQSPSQLRRFTGTWGIVVGLGMATGPLAGGVIVGTFGWRALPMASALAAAIFIGLALWLLPPTRPTTTPHYDWNGIAVLACMALALTAAVIGLGERRMGAFAAATGVTVLLGVVLVRRFTAHGRFPVPAIARHSRPFRIAMLVAAMNYFCLGGGIFLLSTAYFQGALKLSPVEAGWALVPLAIGYAVGARVAPRLMDRTTPFLAIAVAGGLSIFATTLVLALVASMAPGWAVMAAAAAFGAGSGMANTPTNALAMSELPPDQSGIAGAFASSTRQVGQALGIAVSGTTYTLLPASTVLSSMSWLPILLAASVITGAGFRTRFPGNEEN